MCLELCLDDCHYNYTPPMVAVPVTPYPSFNPFRFFRNDYCRPSVSVYPRSIFPGRTYCAPVSHIRPAFPTSYGGATVTLGGRVVPGCARR